MKRYNPSAIEPKWQAKWSAAKINFASHDQTSKKMYVSGMFPYPSGAGMHIGHAFSYTIVDAIGRFYRQHDFNVLTPMGWDTFGLPSENYAIKTGIAPAVVTAQNIDNFKKQFAKMGVGIDWSKEVNSSDPKYYKWTQWVFKQLFERGLAYQKESMQWWCPVDKTVLANEQVEAGKCWRCQTAVEKKSMKQWFFKITEYADQLLQEIDSLDWPNKIKVAQKNWIGRSVGAEIDFRVDDSENSIKVFTTRPDTIFGATAIVLAPEHRLAKELLSGPNADFALEYIEISNRRSEIERMSEAKDKTGVFTGSFATNPATGENIPIWVADYVLGNYGTGAIMLVPGHDERDYDFAVKYSIPIVKVFENEDSETEFGGEGELVNSKQFDGMQTSDAREEIVAWLESQQIGKSKTTYKMHDWLISRQRYWGAPIPIVHCENDGAVAVPDDQLPVLLPEVYDYKPKGDGRSVLATVDDWVNTTCPKCGKPAIRETDTMDGYACSSWYLLRYADPNNDERAWDPEIINYWAPIDYYVGGDHAVAHLLYVRFWTHVFNDMGLTNFKEPVKKLVFHGHVLAEGGQKMSKSKGNVLDPLDIINQGYGADTLRTYLMFMGPIDLDLPWDSKGIAGVYRFINRIYTLVQEYLESEKTNSPKDDEVKRLTHKTIKKVTEDYRELSFNTVIASLMEFTNELYKFKTEGFSDAQWKESLKVLLQLVAPLAPHAADELWTELGEKDFIQQASWPKWDEDLIQDQTMTIVVQVNGKVRAKLTVDINESQEDIIKKAKENSHVASYFGEKEPKKVVYVQGRLISFVI